jgi:hypothetical protein
VKFRRFIVASLACIAFAGLAAACGEVGNTRSNPNAAPPRLPVEPGKDATPVELPRVARDIKPWKQPRLVDTRDWQLARADLGDDDIIRYRVPQQWTVDSRGRGRSGDGLVQSYAVPTAVDKEKLSLEAYAAQLAEGSTLYYKRIQNDESVAYLTVREISIAPSDPNVPSFMYHTAVVESGDRIAKLEVRYDAKDRWRFANQANAIIGTIQLETAVRAEEL